MSKGDFLGRKWLIILVSGWFAVSVPAWSANSDALPIDVGMAAPDFTTLHYAFKTELSFYDSFEGHPTLLIFIQTACRSCHREMQFVQKLLVQYPQLRAFVVFVDLRDRQIESYIQRTDLHILCCVAWDESDSIANLYGVTFSPVTFLINKDRYVRAVYKGFYRGSDRTMKDDIEKLISD